ncbi:MAG: FecR domain-containing protein [Acetobacteraceae bacterium]|nr:FecR domain-containing protein [Acetobacteraceae bacterium]
MPNKQGDAHQREQDALAWLVRLHGTPTAADRRRFDAWLTEPRNGAAFDRAEALWRQTEAPAHDLAREEAPALDALVAAARAPGAHDRPRWGRRFTLAAVAAVAIGGVWLERPTLLADAFADVATARGEQRRVTLADGSAVLLDADSALSLRFDAGERRLRLLRGAAFFEVVPDAAPFIVEAAEGEVRVLGTTFAVSLAGEATTVSVLSGRVEVQPAGGRRAVLGAGQQLRYRGALASAPAPADPEAAFTWREGRLVFHQATLRDVVAAIGRHRAGRILILDGALGERRVTGSFPAADTEAALASLQAILGFRRQDLTGHLVLLR